MGYGVVISFGPEGFSLKNRSEIHIDRSHKGKSMIGFPSDCTVIDLETTGLDPLFDEIIEIAALRIRNGEIADTFSSLVKPSGKIDSFITELTGITNEMLKDAPSPKKAFSAARDFIGQDIVIGHNVHFDINFLYDWFESILEVPFPNDFVDTMRLARKALPELQHHRLADIAEALGVEQPESHRALPDCQTTFSCFRAIYDRVTAKGTIEDFIDSFKWKNLDLRTIKADGSEFDETHPLFGKHCVFTGVLEKMARADAAQLVVNIGGICDNNVTKKTNFLILGNNDYCKTIKDGKSSKQKKAEAYKLEGQEIEIIPENVFYGMMDI